MKTATIALHSTSMPSVHTDCINNYILNCHFLDKLKYAYVTPVYKKYDSTDKTNYRPISILPSLSNVLEKILYKQIDSFFEHKLSNLLCGFRKNLLSSNLYKIGKKF